jgi:hypothetical protein
MNRVMAMKTLSCRLPGSLATTLLLVGLLQAARPVAAGELTAFLAFPSPSDPWGHGYGAALSAGFLRVLSFEGEAAQIPGNISGANMNSFTASAFLSPPIGPLSLYGGLGVGLFRQTLGPDSDTGHFTAVVVGAKAHLGGLFVLRADYRWITLSGVPLLPLDHRFALGAGISF